MDGELKLLLHGVRVVVVAFVTGLPAKPIIDMDAVVAAMAMCPSGDPRPAIAGALHTPSTSPILGKTIGTR